MNLIDQIEEILEKTITAATEQGITSPASVRVHPDVLYRISLIEGWFQHRLFHTQDSGVTSRYGPNASNSSPVVNRVFVSGQALPIIEDPHIYFVSLEYGIAWN